MRHHIVLLLCLAFLAVPAFAGDGTLSLSPAVVTLRGELGQSTTQTLRLVNGTSQDAAFELEAQDVTVRNGHRVNVRAGEIAGSIAATAVFSERALRVPAGQSASVTVTVTLPQGSSQRAVAIIFRGTKQMVSNGVPVFASLGSLLTFTASEAIEVKAETANVQPQTATTNLGVTQRCSNVGTEPVVVRGVIAVLDDRGALVGRSDLAPRRILPSESTELAGEYPGELEPGNYRLLMTYEYEGRSLVSTAEVAIR
jgi:hypothetical protein